MCLPKHNPLQLVSSQFGSGECVWLSVGLCSNDAATRPAFGAASAYEKRILDGGPSMYIHTYVNTFIHILQSKRPQKKNARTWWIYIFMFVVDSFHFCYAFIYLCLVCFLLFGLMICMQIRLKDWPGRKQRVAADQHFIWITSTRARCESNWLGMKNAIYKKGNTIPPP
jgi:hypothetical protein